MTELILLVVLLIVTIIMITLWYKLKILSLAYDYHVDRHKYWFDKYWELASKN